jgi:hypothetical protein
MTHLGCLLGSILGCLERDFEEKMMIGGRALFVRWNFRTDRQGGAAEHVL